MCGAELTSLPAGVQRVAAALQGHNHPHAPVMLNDAARTAQQAADGLGVALGQIAKSIVFKRLADDAAVLVVTSGDRRVDAKRVEALVGPLDRADAEFVKAKTGFSIGGVSPLAHATEVVTLVDVDLFRFDTIWAAAGHPHAVFPLSPAQLCQMVGVAPSNVVEGAADKQVDVAHARLAERAEAVRKLADAACGAQSGSVPSPCMSVCTMNADRSWCVGCLRSIDEIRAWSRADDAAKRAIWQQIAQRLQGAAA